MTPALAKLWATNWPRFQSKPAIYTLAALLACAVLLLICRRKWPTSAAKSSERTDPTRPDVDAAPIDLTTIGAAVTLAADHPILRGGSPSEISPELNRAWSSEEVGHAFSLIRLRLEALEQSK